MHAWEHSRFSRSSGPIGLIVLTCAGVVALSSIGLGEIDKRWIGPLNAVVNIFTAGPFALAYALGAWGWGRPLAWLVARGSASRHYIQFALGLGLMLFMSHALGVLGVLSAGAHNEHANAARVWGWASVGAGIVLLADQVARTSLRPERWPVVPKAALLLAPGAAVLIVAACNAPGALWQSEHNAYDALSYHLQLPKEWAAGSRLWPVNHNVYSALPSYVEGAFLHLGTLVPGPADPLARMVGGEGLWILACQFLHAIMTCAGAILVGRAATVACLGCGVTARRAGFLGVLAGGLALGTPWTTVTGSLPYNESGVLVAFAGGLLAALDGEMRPWARGVAAGLLAGIATSCKPTSAFLAAPVIGLVLLARMPVRAWPLTILAGTVAGCAAVAPWLVRNYQATGNAVFPFAAQQLGMGHWTLEQVARYGRAHAFNGTALERLGRLVSDSHGLRHEQWALTLIVLGASAVASIVWKPSRALAIILCAGLVIQAGAWAFLTHLQSRFLLPMIVPVSVLSALMGATLLARFGGSGLSLGARSLAGTAAALVPLVTAAWTIRLFVVEASNEPNRHLALGPVWLTGRALEERVRTLPEREAQTVLEERNHPVGFINCIIRPHEEADAGVYLLGDGAPLYILGASGLPGVAPGSNPRQPQAARSPVYYHTTWDYSLLGHAMQTHPAKPRAWTEFLRSMDVRYVLINYDELVRLIHRDQNYDPGVTLRQIVRWIEDPDAGLVEVRAWARPGAERGEISQALFRLEPPPLARPEPVESAPQPAEGARP